jgi:hypothetical protein
MMASALCLMSSAVVAQPETLIRMAGRSRHTVGPHQHVPSSGRPRRGLCLVVGGRPDEHLVEHDVVRYLHGGRRRDHAAEILARAGDRIAAASGSVTVETTA